MDDETKGGGQNPPETLYGKIVQDGQEVYIANPVPVRHKMEVGEKTRRAMALKLSGASYASIAQHLGYSDASAARKAVMRGMKKAEQENAGELRRIHYGRLEHILMLLWPDVNAKDMPSINTALSVMDRMSTLFGLNAAEKLEVSQGAQTVIVADGDKDAYIRALQEAGREITGEVGSSSHDVEDGDGDDDDGEASGTA
jgi:hypothetical protein